MKRSFKNIFALGIWLILSFIPGVIGSPFSPDYWYVSLNKPSWNPPGYVFGPVWTLLYILIGVSFWLIWKEAKISIKKPYRLPGHSFLSLQPAQ